MMSIQELAVCAMYDIPVVFLVLNNSGYVSIRDGQDGLLGRNIGSEFNRHAGNKEAWSVDFPAMARSFGFEMCTRIAETGDLEPAIRRALDSRAPALIEVPITRDVSVSAAEVVGWWDFPLVPTAPDEPAQDYPLGLAAEQHQGRDTSRIDIVRAPGAVG